MIKNQKECPKMSQLQERRLLEKNTSASDKNDAIKCREDFHKKCRRGKCIGLYDESNIPICSTSNGYNKKKPGF